MTEPETLTGSITAELAKLLREPFPQVQKVKKEWTDKKTGQQKSITLDYISHAVVTDRLLQVDPNFTFEPLTETTSGWPIVTDKGLAPGDSVGVWGRLTIKGSSVVEFCSGKDLLDAYSRCLCRAAMRRGVALDLWIRDDEFREKSEPKAVVSKPTLKSWKDLETALRAYGDATWEDWMAFAAQARALHFPDKDKLSAADKAELWQWNTKAALELTALCDPGQFPPPGRQELRNAWKVGLGMEEELEGPPWRMSPDETDRPPREGPVEEVPDATD